MGRPKTENLTAWVTGRNLNVFQKADAVIEYNKLLDYVKVIEEQLRIGGVNNCPNLTNLWNEAVFKQERGEHSVFDTNDCWGALRTLEKHGLCKINNY